MMNESTASKPRSQLTCVTNWAQRRMPMRCSASSHDSMPCLCALTSGALSANTRPSWSSVWRTISRHCMRSSKFSTPTARHVTWVMCVTCPLCLGQSSGQSRYVVWVCNDSEGDSSYTNQLSYSYVSFIHYYYHDTISYNTITDALHRYLLICSWIWIFCMRLIKCIIVFGDIVTITQKSSALCCHTLCL